MVHNYLRWRLVSTYINDLSYDYVHANRLYLAAYYGYALHSSNEAYCTRELIRRFPLAIQRLYTMNSTRPGASVAAVRHSQRNVRRRNVELIACCSRWRMS